MVTSRVQPGTAPPSDGLEGSPNLLGMDYESIVQKVEAHGGTPGQATNLMRGLHGARCRSIRDIANVNRGLLGRLESALSVEALRVHRVHRSRLSPGTRKLILETRDGQLVESVLFSSLGSPEKVTLCLSSQIGCRLACSFCATGHMGYSRNLGADEILAQVWAAFDYFEEGEILNGVVFMGMGDPLDNEEAVLRSIDIMHDFRGFGIACDKITVSTTGILPALGRLRRRYPRLSVAISLHAVSDELRSRLVPINRKYPLPDLMGVLRDNPPKTGKKYSIEYCLIEGVNDSVGEARALVNLLEGIQSLVQIIPLNSFPGLNMRPPAPGRIAAFATAIQESGGACHVRDSRGPDILAACGQLGGTMLESGPEPLFRDST